MKMKLKKLLIYLVVPLIILSCFEWTGGAGSIAVNVGGSKVDAPVGDANEHTSSNGHDSPPTAKGSKPPDSPGTTSPPPQTEHSTTEHTNPSSDNPPPVTDTTSPEKEKLIALTFDDGPSPKNTVKILNILKENDCKATFFVIGTNAQAHPELLKQAVEIGCEIGTHSYAHENYKKMSYREIKSDMAKMKKVIFDATGIEPVLFRVPFGAFDKKVKAAAGMPLIQWSIDTNDWRYKTTTNEKRTKAQIERDKQIIIDSVLKNAKDGDIILMHDVYSMSANSCAEIIPKLKEMGFKLVTVSELMQARGIKMKNGKVYSNAY
jgi:peptidoglycan/xylan/chitin deacetylase (PgdA/CDA1 family)